MRVVFTSIFFYIANPINTESLNNDKIHRILSWSDTKNDTVSGFHEIKLMLIQERTVTK